MPPLRFIHTADLHLSRPFGFLPPEQANERRADQRASLAKIADIAIERHVDLMLFAGDIFDRPEPDPTDHEALIQALNRLSKANIRTFIIPGNHDYIHPNSIWHHISADGLHIFTDTEWKSVDIPELDVSVYGMAFNRDNSNQRAFQDIRINADAKSIVMAHASYESFGALLEKYHPFSYDELRNLNASYVALGHYHRFDMITGDIQLSACYPGTPEGISFDAAEVGDRYIIFGEISEDGRTTIEPIQVNRKVMKSVGFDCTSFQTEANLIDAIRAVCDNNALISINMKGVVSPELMPVISGLSDRFRGSCRYLTIGTSNLAMQTDVSEMDNTIKGRYFRYMIDRIDNADGPESARILQKAIELGISALDGKLR